VRGSFVPPGPIRQLRDLTRARTAITRERSRAARRLEKLLEDAGIKLSPVASDILGVSGRAMLGALIAGDRDPARMADLARRRMRSKIPGLTEALAGRSGAHHAFPARVHLDLTGQRTAAIGQLTERIEAAMEPFRSFRKLICPIPGISTLTADVVVAGTGAGMTRFPRRRPPRLMGRDHAREPRARRQGQIQPHPARQPLPARRPGCRGHGLRPEPRHLPRREVPPHRHPPRTAEGQRRGPARHAHRHLEHGNQQRLLRRPRRRLPHPPQPRTSTQPRHNPTPGHGIPRHPREGIMTTNGAG
jgi:hypothetical protein